MHSEYLSYWFSVRVARRQQFPTFQPSDHKQFAFLFYARFNTNLLVFAFSLAFQMCSHNNVWSLSLPHSFWTTESIFVWVRFKLYNRLCFSKILFPYARWFQKVQVCSCVFTWTFKKIIITVFEIQMGYYFECKVIFMKMIHFKVCRHNEKLRLYALRNDPQ